MSLNTQIQPTCIWRCAFSVTNSRRRKDVIVERTLVAHSISPHGLFFILAIFSHFFVIYKWTNEGSNRNVYLYYNKPSNQPNLLVLNLIFLICLFALGCGGIYNHSIGAISLTHTDPNSKRCTWTIGNSGIGNATALISVQEIRNSWC